MTEINWKSASVMFVAMLFVDVVFVCDACISDVCVGRIYLQCLYLLGFMCVLVYVHDVVCV